MGGTGRVGQMVLHHWNFVLPSAVQVIEQHRDPARSTGIHWCLTKKPKETLDSFDIDAIVCLAGVTPGPNADLLLNTPLASTVMREASRAGIKRVLLASSSAVYGAGDGTPFNESSPTNPINEYGKAKLEMEQSCAHWREEGLEVCCLRIGNVAGADALLLNVAGSTSNQPLHIDRFADGRGPVRSYIGPKTLAEVLYSLATHKGQLPETLNIAAPKVVYMEELAHAANHPFDLCSAQEGSHQSITLDCDALSTFHAFDTDASEATQMVAQWKEATSR
nr:SDR family oxidoreductase [Octadecabacter temperatus]